MNNQNKSRENTSEVYPVTLCLSYNQIEELRKDLNTEQSKLSNESIVLKYGFKDSKEMINYGKEYNLFEKKELTEEEKKNLDNLSMVLKQTMKELFKDNEEQTSEDISNILAKQRQKEKGFKLE